MKYVDILKVQGSNGTLYINTKYAIAPIHDEIFVVLGKDRLLYTPIDSDIGKEFAVRVVKGQAWNIKKVKIWKKNKNIIYTIPKGFGKALRIEKGSIVLVLSINENMQIIPFEKIENRIGPFREPTPS